MPVVIGVIGDSVYAIPLIRELDYLGKYYSIKSFRMRATPSKPALEMVDIFIFTGGEDVDPSVYKHLKHFTTSSSADRDATDFAVFNYAIKNNKPMMGICRGSQFLWAAIGGTLIQDCDNHAGKNHTVLDIETGAQYNVNSTHHQMANIQSITNDLQVLAIASPNICSYKTAYDPHNDAFITLDKTLEVEAWKHSQLPILGIQWHPEMESCPVEGVNLSRKYIRDLLIQK